jgi:hypothetical protein
MPEVRRDATTAHETQTKTVESYGNGGNNSKGNTEYDDVAYPVVRPTAFFNVSLVRLILPFWWARPYLILHPRGLTQGASEGSNST